MIETATPRIETLEQSDTYGKFVVEPLERGYGGEPLAIRPASAAVVDSRRSLMHVD